MHEYRSHTNTWHQQCDSAGAIGQSARLFLGHEVSQAGAQLPVLRLFLPAALEVVHERPAAVPGSPGLPLPAMPRSAKRPFPAMSPSKE